MGEIIIDSGFGFLKARELTLMFIAAFGAILAMPYCRSLACRLGLTAKVNDGHVPVVGGMIVCLFAACMVLMHINRLLMAGVLLMGLFGMLNDRFSFGSLVSLAFEFILCTVYLSIGYGGIYPMFWLHLFLMVCVISSIKMLEGINGLPIAIFIVAFIPLALIGYKIFITSICGALIVLYYFNVFNRHSRVSLGNGTSMALGFMIAGLIFAPGFVMYGSLDQASWYCALDSVMFVLLLLPFPVIDMVRSVIHRIVRGRSPLYPDNSQLHLLLAHHGVRPGLVSLLMVGVNIVGFILIWLLMDLIEIVL